MCCKARSSLIIGLYSIAVYLEYQDRTDHSKVFGDTKICPEWTSRWYGHRTAVHEFVWKVFWYKNYPNEKLPVSQWASPYQDTAGDLLKLLRHLIEHVYLHSKEWFKIQDEAGLFQPSHQQTISSVDEADLFASMQFPIFLPEFIKLLFENQNMNGDFAGYWDNYKSTKDL